FQDLDLPAQDPAFLVPLLGRELDGVGHLLSLLGERTGQRYACRDLHDLLRLDSGRRGDQRERDRHRPHTPLDRCPASHTLLLGSELAQLWWSALAPSRGRRNSLQPRRNDRRRRELLSEAVLAAPVRVLHGALAEPREPHALVNAVCRRQSRVGPRDDVPIARRRRPAERLLHERTPEAAATVPGE